MPSMSPESLIDLLWKPFVEEWIRLGVILIGRVN